MVVRLPGAAGAVLWIAVGSGLSLFVSVELLMPYLVILLSTAGCMVLPLFHKWEFLLEVADTTL